MSSAIVSPVAAYLGQLHQEVQQNKGGELGSYIPELAKANPDWFGIAIAALDGEVYEVGDSRQAFSIQSISKPLVYGLALQTHGIEAVLKSIWVEPTGEAFNSISLESESGRPLNPMINAGAIAASSLAPGKFHEERFQSILDTISLYAGRPLAMNRAVFESERSTGHRNRAIGHLLRNYEILKESPDSVLDLYFSQCAIEITCRDLAVIGATLANGGVNPVTGQLALRKDLVDKVLSVMTACGMYDHSGTWVYEVGLPAKSGVAGGIVAVLPGQFGIGVFSPRLDVRGNSARGVAVCKKLAADLSLHFLLPPRPAQATLRASHSLAKLRSRRRRSGPQQACLDAHGTRALVLELQGDLRFAGAERIARKMTEASPELDCCVLDFRRVTDVDPAASLIIVDLVRRFAETDKAVIFADVRQEALRSALSTLPPTVHDGLHSPQLEVELDRALERAEELVLARFGGEQASQKIPRLTLAEHDLCTGMTEEELAILGNTLESLSCDPGTLVVRRGDPADALYLLIAGEVSVLLGLPDGTQRRLGTLSAGMGFGEAALLTQGVRSADIRADSHVECYRLSIPGLRALETEAPGLVIKLLTNLLRTSTAITARLTAEVSSLAS